jgi:DNA-binding transcriptional regulator YhcF (GntR family)
MEFCIEKHSSIPVVKQIQEQVKVAVTMGLFRSGDTLPSIREVEKQTGINRGQIHKAYLALKQSGLVVLTRGSGAVVSAVAVSPRSMNEKCLQLSRKIVSTVRQMGVSPTAFARYLTQHAQGIERNEPFLSYVTSRKEIAVERAAEISQLWQIPIIGLTPPELKRIVRKRCTLRKILVNHNISDYVQSQLPGRKIEVIPVEIHYTEQTIKNLGRMRSNSSVLLVLTPEGMRNSRFIIESLRRWIKSPEIAIAAISARAVSSFDELLRSSRYDCVIVGAGAQDKVPKALRHGRRILLLHAQLDPASLEAARVRAGVIV